MAVPEIILEEGGATGLIRDISEQRAAAALPTTVKLGRRVGPVVYRAPSLAAFVDRDMLEAALPERVDWSVEAMNSLRRMYANDRYGCCVISGKAHHAGVWSAADKAEEIIASDTEIVREYQTICGPGDRGCYIPEVLEVMTRRGLTMGGKARRIGGYVTVNHRDTELTKAGIYLLGGLTIGFNLPSSWASSAVWDVTNSRIVGGHDVAIVGYDPDGVLVSSWGRLYRMTWAAWTDRRYIDECYALLSPDWTNDDRLAPSGLDVTGLETALKEIGQGRQPKPPEPFPPVPPVPPDPTPPRPPASVEGTVLPREGGGWDVRLSIGPPYASAVAGADPYRDAVDFMGLILAIASLWAHVRAKAPPNVILQDILAIAAALGVTLPL